MDTTLEGPSTNIKVQPFHEFRGKYWHAMHILNALSKSIRNMASGPKQLSWTSYTGMGAATSNHCIV